jgi:hypothetical protein
MTKSSMLCFVKLLEKNVHFIRLLNKKNTLRIQKNSKNYTPIQTQQILVKDFYRPIAQTSTNWQVFILGENQVTN